MDSEKGRRCRREDVATWVTIAPICEPASRAAKLWFPDAHRTQEDNIHNLSSVLVPLTSKSDGRTMELQTDYTNYHVSEGPVNLAQPVANGALGDYGHLDAFLERADALATFATLWPGAEATPVHRWLVQEILRERVSPLDQAQCRTELATVTGDVGFLQPLRQRPRHWGTQEEPRELHAWQADVGTALTPLFRPSAK